MTTQNLRRAILCGTFLMIVSEIPVAGADVPIKINAWSIHQGDNIVYRYQVENNSASIVYMVDLGLNSPGKELPGKPWSLNPNYSDVPVPLDSAHCKPFYYMNCSIAVFQFDYMPEPKTNVMMEGVENDITPPPKILSGAENIRPGTSSSVAEITIPIAYQSTDYLTAFGEVFLLDSNTRNPDGTVVTEVEVPFTKVDVTSPTFSFTLNPATLWPPNSKLMPVNATISVKDDYDPEPEIRLESITSNEVLADGDIQDAQLNSDDRSFALSAKRSGTSPAGRLYTVTYSATDASGNQSTTSATVTVPHDQEK